MDRRDYGLGLAIIGGCLLIGLLTRLNCVLAAGFLLMLYFSSPPWPWLPTPPNSPGNTLYVNRNVIEMFALLALATTASGRWFGVDALVDWTLGALFGGRRRGCGSVGGRRDTANDAMTRL